MVEPRWEVKIGSTVSDTDGEYGRLQQLLLDPHQERVFALLVRPYGLVPSHPVVVPLEAIAAASETEVRLKISREQMESLPQYWPGSSLVVEDQTYEADDELFAVRGKQGIEVGRAPGVRKPGMIENQLTGFEHEHLGLRLRAGQHVFCQDGHAGWVSLILLDAGGRARDFVMHSGQFHLTGRKLIVPSAWIQEVDRENVHLSVEKRDLKNLPEYYPDDVLGEAVDHALWSDEILRNTDYQELGISVQDGIVRLRGHVGTSRNKKKAEDAARSVPGVLGLENDLVLDQDLVTTVAQALGKNGLTRPERISVGAQHGFVTLSGHVGSAAIREAAGTIAASVPQVRGVINDLRAPGVVIDPEEYQIRQPGIGREVYAADMQLGQVERIIIDPHTRRVTAFVARGLFPDHQKKDNYRLPDEGPQEESSVVIPIKAVRCTTNSTVLLEARGAGAALYRSFEPADFISPAADWQPPFPYRWKHVLFDGGDWRNPPTNMAHTEKTSND